MEAYQHYVFADSSLKSEVYGLVRQKPETCNLLAGWIYCILPIICRSFVSVIFSRVIDVDLHDDQPTCSNSPDISLTVNYLGRDFRLRYERHQTVKDVMSFICFFS